ncbi:predicted protein [Thalassiosira pseudonana CCMP1335]|uniref:Uncharacterized protein n=1 Tax=Thalassiosira pseudonana TaxID=35128 RepID=B8C0H7_THAPS|nr:predicted protein [Thalassiosira pseudonana CCMP1335]EED93068.1 predicted protein [Thalassiosira pseudonana CCMP1335]
MCICIHCARVTNCQAYHFVEEQHSQPHINKDPTWEPRNGSPTIQVHIRPETSYDLSGTTSYEYDVVECEDFVEEKDAWVKNMPEEIRIANPQFVPS